MGLAIRAMRKFSLYSFIFIGLLVCNSSLFSWGLLQGKEKSAHADETATYVSGLYKLYDPFYTGPILAPSAHTVPKGKVNTQPYYYWKRTYGLYTHSWHRRHTRSQLQFQFLAIFQYGINNFMDTSVITQAFLNRNQEQHYFGYGDTSWAFGFQLLEGSIGTLIPSCKFQVQQTFPSGRYQHLVARKLGTDAIGAGAYGTNFSLNFQKDFNSLFKRDIDPTHFHPFRFRWSFGYTINSRTSVEGINSYGGAPGTDGKVKVGNNFTSIFAVEYSFTSHWVLATDVQYTISSASKFFGNEGGAPVGTPENQSWSIAPALEYNLNGNFGALVGAWFSLTGRNTGSFVTGIASFTWMF